MLEIAKQLQSVIDGKVDLKFMPEHIMELGKFYVHTTSAKILDTKGIENRRRMIAELPDLIRPYVQEEIMSIFKWRKTKC